MSQYDFSRTKEVAFQAVILGLGFGLLANFAHAQTKGMAYNGPRASNIKTYQKGPEGDFAFCEKDPAARQTKDTYAACVNAIAGAKSMAENCAQANGELDGYRRGYSWAFNSALNFAQKDPNHYNAGKASIYNDSNTQPYVQQKAEEVNRNTFNEGAARGASLVIQRFTDFVDSGASKAGSAPSSALPNPIPVPPHGSPYQNPYVSLMPGQFQSIDDLINRAQFDANQLGFVNRYDSMWGVARPQWNVRNLYTQDGIYNPNPSEGCMNAQNALTRYISNDRMGKGLYSGYAKGPSVAKDGTVPGAGRPGDGRPGAPAGGVTKGEVTKGDAAAGAVAAPAFDLQQIYANAFRTAYSNYANYYYSVGFHRNLDLGQYYGDSVGRQLGSEYAYQTGRRDAFNDSFSQAEASTFTRYAVNGYDSGFKNKYQEYISNPQPAFELVDVIGEIDDGIIQPNEKFSVVVRVKNYGGVGTQFQAQLAGNVTEVQGFTLKAPALSSQVITSPIAARVATASGSNARVVLQVAGREVPISQYVTDQVTPTGITYDATIPSGIVKVTVTVVNHSKKKSYDVVKVNLTDAFGHNLSQNVGFLEAGQALPVAFSISDYSPIDLIDGKVNLQAQASLGSLMVGTKSIQVSSKDVNLDFAQAFDLAIATPELASRTQALIDRIYTEVHDEAVDAKRTQYDEDPTTLIANLVKAKQSHPQSAQAQLAYRQLADRLSPIVNNMKKALATGWLGGKSQAQKYFNRQIAILKSN